MNVDALLTISEKIDYGIRDDETTNYKFRPLWKYPFLLEVFLTLLHTMSAGDEAHEHALTNFKNVCSLLCPDFVDILEDIDRNTNIESEMKNFAHSV